MNKQGLQKNFTHILIVILCIILYSVIVFSIPYGITAIFTHSEQIRLGVMFLVGYVFEFILVIAVIVSID